MLGNCIEGKLFRTENNCKAGVVYKFTAASYSLLRTTVKRASGASDSMSYSLKVLHQFQRVMASPTTRSSYTTLRGLKSLYVAHHDSDLKRKSSELVVWVRGSRRVYRHREPTRSQGPNPFGRGQTIFTHTSWVRSVPH